MNMIYERVAVIPTLRDVGSSPTAGAKEETDLDVGFFIGLSMKHFVYTTLILTFNHLI